MSVGAELHAERIELLPRLALQIWRVGGEDIWRAFENQHLRHRRVDVAEVLRHIKLRDVADGAGEFDASGAAANDDEVERRMRAALHHLAFGKLEGKQNTATDLGRIFDRLQARSKLGPVVLAEVGVRRTSGDDEVVVLQLDARLEVNALLRKIEADSFVHQDINVGMVAHERADRLRNIGRRKHREGDLIKQGLEEVIVFSIHDRDIDRQLRQFHGRVDTGKAAAEYDDPRSAFHRFELPLLLPSFGLLALVPLQVQPITDAMPKGHVQLILFRTPCYLFDALILFGLHEAGRSRPPKAVFRG